MPEIHTIEGVPLAPSEILRYRLALVIDATGTGTYANLSSLPGTIRRIGLDNIKVVKVNPVTLARMRGAGRLNFEHGNYQHEREEDNEWTPDTAS